MSNLRKLAGQAKLSPGDIPAKPRALTFRRQTRAKKAEPARMVAYDLETTNIGPGTPQPLYITAYGESPAIHYASEIETMAHLGLILVNNFLTPEHAGVKFVAWNGNRFDGFIIAAALITDNRFIIRPYLTQSKMLRGLRVEMVEIPEWHSGKKPPSWEFLDGIAMLGLAGVSLSKFLANFAPAYRKLSENINFAVESFNSKNPKHCSYAMRDSEGLYHGMVHAQNIFLEYFNQPLTVTMGGACIKVFQAHIPPDTQIAALKPECELVIRDFVMRGGYCHIVRPYKGPIWKYDINQAYAAAMREAKLPSSYALHCEHGIPKNAAVYIARVSAHKQNNKIPFYHRSESSGRLSSHFSLTDIDDTWLTSIECEQLRAEGWKLDISECWAWHETFNMCDYVDRLESIRMNCEGGPNGPIGTMIKAAGNHSYGKTLESLEPVEYIIAGENPQNLQYDYHPFYPPDSDNPLEHVFFRFLTEDEIKGKVYHHPQIGAFITAHVRMVVRRAALLSPVTWLYADTDCIVFSSDVTSALDIDPKRYGAWKIEESGTVYSLIAKKVYVEIDASKTIDETDTTKKQLKRSAKGLNVRRLTVIDFERWGSGIAPIQEQTQLARFDKVMAGAEMYRKQTRRGTAVNLKV